MSRICVIGGGYVGLVTSACLAKLGHDVTCLEADLEKTVAIKRGRLPITEPNLDALWRKFSRIGRLRVTNEVAPAIAHNDFIFICVGTPASEGGTADLSYVAAAAESIADHVLPDDRPVAVIKSTVPVGTAELVSGILAERSRFGFRPEVVSNPEFLREGAAVRDFLRPDRVIVGSANRPAAEMVAELYAPLKRPIVFCDSRTAELIKYASNAFLATKISFINEMAELCEAFEVDVKVLAEATGLDHRIGPHYLEAGLGWGGSCLPKDLAAVLSMAASEGLSSSILESVLEVNQRQPHLIARKLRRILGSLNGKTIAVLGLTFKPDCDDLRDSPALSLISLLQQEGCCIRAYDPASMPLARLQPSVVLCESPYVAASSADAVVLATAWEEFRTLDFKRLRDLVSQPVFIDGRNCLAVATVEEAGFIYAGVGRGRRLARAASLIANTQQIAEGSKPRDLTLASAPERTL